MGVITLEYKKVFMDEWTGDVNLQTLYELRTHLAHCLTKLRHEFL